MGVVNLTPDSFSDGGKFNTKNKAVKHVFDLLKFGADLIDIGGESTRPGSKTISPQLEFKRVKYVLQMEFYTFLKHLSKRQKFRETRRYG